MGVKRKAQEAFSNRFNTEKAQKSAIVRHVSAFAAAKARSQQIATPDTASTSDIDLHIEESQSTATGLVAAHRATSSALGRQSMSSTVLDQQALETSALSTPKGTNTRLASVRHCSGLFNPSTLESIQLSLDRDEFITPVGEYDLEVLAGSVSIYGATLHAKSGRQRVYALSTHALPQIVAKTADTLLRITSVESMVHNLERFSPLFRNIAAPIDHSTSFMLLENSFSDPAPRSLFPLETTKQYQTTLTQLAMKSESKNGRIAVACLGGKSTGKSTFARHVCNKLLTRASQQRCLFFDLDPGQPEFGPPGQIYLVEVLTPILGPAYTHLASKQSSNFKLLAAHTIAATSFKDDPQHYMDCVAALFNHKQVLSAKKSGACPLVVNTCGWVSGLGARVLCDILQFDITDTVVIDTIDAMVLAAANAGSEDCHELDRPTFRMSSRSPAELRQMQTMAYFHTSAEATDASVHRLVATSIAHWRPWHVSYDERPGSIADIVSYGQPLDPEFLVDVLEGSIVAIVSRTSGEKSIVQPSRTPVGLPLSKSNRPLDLRTHEYHGLAFVRAIDTTARQLHLIAPLSQETMAVLMKREVVLVRGAFDSPDWAFLESVYDDSFVDHGVERPWLARREMVGVEGAVWRLRHPPTSAKASYR
ncbi:hypothetical protein AMS68_005686 [Peltaster fructicola]|uniref:Polynucleotide 5'-hydroxyl-kinase GRC3 n=1 Tax=Peltaster fructicola TaxID=286661 RepID=A0A6H0XZY0_9PEZI|nr:hypothetical protein AMS68_005686 [Peltaster fructicola]